MIGLIDTKLKQLQLPSTQVSTLNAIPHQTSGMRRFPMGPTSKAAETDAILGIQRTGQAALRAGEPES